MGPGRSHRVLEAHAFGEVLAPQPSSSESFFEFVDAQRKRTQERSVSQDPDISRLSLEVGGQGIEERAASIQYRLGIARHQMANMVILIEAILKGDQVHVELQEQKDFRPLSSDQPQAAATTESPATPGTGNGEDREPFPSLDPALLEPASALLTQLASTLDDGESLNPTTSRTMATADSEAGVEGPKADSWTVRQATEPSSAYNRRRRIQYGQLLGAKRLQLLESAESLRSAASKMRGSVVRSRRFVRDLSQVSQVFRVLPVTSSSQTGSSGPLSRLLGPLSSFLHPRHVKAAMAASDVSGGILSQQGMLADSRISGFWSSAGGPSGGDSGPHALEPGATDSAPGFGSPIPVLPAEELYHELQLASTGFASRLDLASLSPAGEVLHPSSGDFKGQGPGAWAGQYSSTRLFPITGDPQTGALRLQELTRVGHRLWHDFEPSLRLLHSSQAAQLNRILAHSLLSECVQLAKRRVVGRTERSIHSSARILSRHSLPTSRANGDTSDHPHSAPELWDITFICVPAQNIRVPGVGSEPGVRIMQPGFPPVTVSWPGGRLDRGFQLASEADAGRSRDFCRWVRLRLLSRILDQIREFSVPLTPSLSQMASLAPLSQILAGSGGIRDGGLGSGRGARRPETERDGRGLLSSPTLLEDAGNSNNFPLIEAWKHSVLAKDIQPSFVEELSISVNHSRMARRLDAALLALRGSLRTLPAGGDRLPSRSIVFQSETGSWGRRPIRIHLYGVALAALADGKLMEFQSVDGLIQFIDTRLGSAAAAGPSQSPRR